MLNIQKALKKVIEKFIVNQMDLTEDANDGDTVLQVTSSRRFVCGDVIWVGNPFTGGGEWSTVVRLPDKRSITLDGPLEDSYSAADSIVRKLTGAEEAGRQTLKGVYTGSPNVIQSFPAITVNARRRSAESLTLESVSEKFEIEIGVYIRAADYELQYELMQLYAKAIEDALFRTLYPLVEPFVTSTITETVDPSDTIIKIADNDIFACMSGWIFLESADHLRPNKLINFLGNGVYELAMAVGRDFDVGDTVIMPRRHIYNALPRGTEYGTVNSQKGLLEAAVISWSGTEERRIFVPYRDPLTF